MAQSYGCRRVAMADGAKYPLIDGLPRRRAADIMAR